MKICYVSYAGRESIPVTRYLHNRKLRKYFNRETSVAIVCLAQMLGEQNLPPSTPLYYATGLLKFEEYGLSKLVADSIDENGIYSAKRFIERGIAGISPLTSFKILPNMTLAFISIEHQLCGENAVLYVSATSLLTHAILAPSEGPILIGAGQVTECGDASASFALATRAELAALPCPNSDVPAIAFLRELSKERV